MPDRPYHMIRGAYSGASKSQRVAKRQTCWLMINLRAIEANEYPQPLDGAIRDGARIRSSADDGALSGAAQDASRMLPEMV